MVYCTGEMCPKAEFCGRVKQESTGNNEAWINAPFKILKNGNVKCKFFNELEVVGFDEELEDVLDLMER